MRRYALRDDQWDRIKEELPGREGHVGVTAKDNRLFVGAVLYGYRAGIPWRDAPERFGDPIKIHMRFSRWAKSGVCKRMFGLVWIVGRIVYMQAYMADPSKRSLGFAISAL